MSTTTTDETIRRRAYGREQARALLQLALSDDDCPMVPEARQAFWDELRTAIDQHCPPSAHGNQADQPAPSLAALKMNDLEARAFGQTKLTFGRHAGRTVDEVPLRYLRWLHDQPDEFRTKLGAYLASDRIEREIEAGIRD